MATFITVCTAAGSVPGQSKLDRFIAAILHRHQARQPSTEGFITGDRQNTGGGDEWSDRGQRSPGGPAHCVSCRVMQSSHWY